MTTHGLRPPAVAEPALSVAEGSWAKLSRPARRDGVAAGRNQRAKPAASKDVTKTMVLIGKNPTLDVGSPTFTGREKPVERYN